MCSLYRLASLQPHCLTQQVLRSHHAALRYSTNLLRVDTITELRTSNVILTLSPL